jgi:OOP family OmpA-OmpF porin
MTKLTQIALAAMLACAASSTVMAQETVQYNPSWYVQPSLSIIDPDGGFGTGENGSGAGLKFGKPLNESWDTQIGYTYARSRGNGMRYQQQTLGADALYMFSRKSFRPFLLVGIGAQRDKLDTPIRQKDGSGAYLSTGLGAQMALGDQWSLQADYRRIHAFNSGSELGLDRSHNNYYTVSLNYAFDKPVVTRAVVRAADPMPAPTPVYVPPPAPPVVVAPPAPRFERVTLSSTELFAFDSAVLKTPQPKLDQIAVALKGSPSTGNVTIYGYADHLGSKKYNLALSGRRAESVKTYLVGQGVEANRLSGVAKGEADPVVVCHDRNRAALITCLEPNRRVVIEEITVERRVN